MYKLVKPILFCFDAERIHNITLYVMRISQKSKLLRKIIKNKYEFKSPKIEQTFRGIKFNNPIGLAAGFDKSCNAPSILESLGFGYLELGGITPLAQKGNKKPRLYRLPEDRAIINRMGFNNDGALAAKENLRVYKTTVPLGINVGVNKSTYKTDRYEDYIKVIDILKEEADYFTINISSPNTDDLQDMHNKDNFLELSGKIKRYRDEYNMRKPIFVKITSDINIEKIKDIIKILSVTYDGIIVANTTRYRTDLTSSFANEIGGLSGKPLYNRNIELIKYIYTETKGSLLIIGTGGIMSGEDAIKMIKSGASLVQIYTGLIYEGPSVCKNMNKFIVNYLNKNNKSSIRDIIGSECSI